MYLQAKNQGTLGTYSQTDRIFQLYEAMTKSNNGYGAFLWYCHDIVYLCICGIPAPLILCNPALRRSTEGSAEATTPTAVF